MPPGRSLIDTVKRDSRPSATSPTSITRSSIVEIDVAAGTARSTTFLPLSVSSWPARNAASGAAPRAFDDALLELDQAQDRERDRRFVDGDDAVDDALQRSRTARAPSCATASPSASVGDSGTGTGCACGERGSEARGVLGLDADQRRRRARFAFTTMPMPASRPPPPTGTTIASTVGRLLEDLEAPSCPGPATTCGVVERMDEREAVARGDFARRGRAPR